MAAREGRRWLRQAKQDLAAGRVLEAAGHHAHACFLAQQSGEKAVAAFLFARGAERVWGNSLADLCEDAITFDPSFELLKSVAVLLDKHYFGARYPSALPGGVPAEAYDAVDSARALAIAVQTMAFVLERMEN
jgi:HEPN domain-containing protein